MNNDPQDELQGSFDLKGAGVYRVRKALITKEFAKKREHIYLTSNDVEVKEDQLAGSDQSKAWILISLKMVSTTSRQACLKMICSQNQCLIRLLTTASN
ncbi:hypothetical protein [Streptococcus equi]|uniref:hypothetical protein n=1 Tax=Streptococcus equi TaxID=1336 RepID=UPI001E566A8C|nr:hypothetical protein [Streptococcus equi]